MKCKITIEVEFEDGICRTVSNELDNNIAQFESRPLWLLGTEIGAVIQGISPSLPPASLEKPTNSRKEYLTKQYEEIILGIRDYLFDGPE